MARIDVLNLEWASSGRDIHIIEPVLCYLELNGYTVRRSSYLFGLIKMLIIYPKMLVLSNNCGSVCNFIASKLAYKLGIKVVTLSSEGDYCVLNNENGKNSIESFFWGWDLKKEFPVDLHLEWSSKNIDFIKKYVNNSKDLMKNIKVSGATGFDRYKLFSFKTKEMFLNEHGLKGYKKVVGYAAWGFDALYDKSFCEAATFARTEEYINFHKRNRDLLKILLQNLVSNNPHMIFIMKRHPGELIFEETELCGLEKYDNVLIIKDEEKIEDLINVCDLWMAYESTTCLEAWLLNKETLLINPIPFFIERSDIATGSPVKQSYEEIQKDIDVANVAGFKELESTRTELIHKIIEYDDGINYKRAGDFIIQEMHYPKNHFLSIDKWCIKKIGIEVLKFLIFYSPLRYVDYFRKKIADYLNYSQIYNRREREYYTQEYHKAIQK